MKQILPIFIVAFLFIGCNSNKNNEEYKTALTRIASLNDSAKYDYSLIMKGLNEVDSLALDFLEKIEDKSISSSTIKKNFNDYKYQLKVKSYNDSIVRLFEQRNITDSSLLSLKNEIIETRLLYIQSILDYIEKTEANNEYVEPTMFKYWTLENKTYYYNIDLSYPTYVGQEIMALILSDSLRYASLPNDGLSISMATTDQIDTMHVKLKWYDKKICDTIERSIFCLIQ